MDLVKLAAGEVTKLIREGEVSAQSLVEACLDRIAAEEERVQAWAFLDRDYALEQAGEADKRRRRGASLGPLHGLPVGVKDIFDTGDMPTEDGTPLHGGRRPRRDATAVSLLRAAGAVVMGKTVTTELAVYSPGKTRNPHAPEHTPGGSSSGSAAAVAADMVPLALGSQTNGSVIRPAAFCGVYGYKPSFGLISRQGVLQQSRHLDHVGVFAQSLEDLALLAEPLMAYDSQDPAMAPRARPGLAEVAAGEPPLPPHLAFVKTAAWEQAEEATKEGFAELVEALGEQVEEVELPEPFVEVWDRHRTIFEADLARSFAQEFERGRDQLSTQLREMIERGQTVLAVDYNRAVDTIEVFDRLLGEFFRGCDAIITPAVPGEAPRGLESTGSPAFCTTWTLCGTPALSLPLLRGANGLPIGVQLVGERGDDARLLRTARWLLRAVSD